MDDFYQPNIDVSPKLEGEEFKHCTRVLRKKVGDQIGLFDGKGTYYQATISSLLKDSCKLEITNKIDLPLKSFHVHLAIAPTKSMDRMEWMVEKLGELGIDEISFLQTQHGERPKIKLDRLQKKAISALKQSKSGYLMKINPLIRFNDFIKQTTSQPNRFIAIVEESLPSFKKLLRPKQPIIIMIGPEGDFSKQEMDLASNQGIKRISLGKNTLRTETAGLIACHVVNMINDY
ncbi:MAG: RsmE family RNA methyltransferase [Bacteroidota bacterium]